jgi:hypothetical protein
MATAQPSCPMSVVAAKQSRGSASCTVLPTAAPSTHLVRHSNNTSDQHRFSNSTFTILSARVTSLLRRPAALPAWTVQAHPGASIGIMANCGTSMTITASCIVAMPSQEVLDIRLENADGERNSVCNVPDLPGTALMVYSLAPGDSIYGVQACYRNGRVVGVTFSSAGGPLVCGNPQAPEAVCRSTSVTEPAPMSALYGECGPWGLVEITRVCFNPFYINPVIPITGESCSAQQQCHSSTAVGYCAAIAACSALEDSREWGSEQQTAEHLAVHGSSNSKCVPDLVCSDTIQMGQNSTRGAPAICTWF